MDTKLSNLDVDTSVTIKASHYDQLLEREEFLRCLESLGVEDWGGYEEAVELYHEGRD